MAKFYKMNDYEWWASNVSVEETLKFYLKETGVTEDETYPVEDIRECDIDKEGQYIPLEDTDRIAELEAEGIEESIVSSGKKTWEQTFGSVMKRGGKWFIEVPFRKALEFYNFSENDVPIGIASTEW